MKDQIVFLWGQFFCVKISLASKNLINYLMLIYRKKIKLSESKELLKPWKESEMELTKNILTVIIIKMQRGWKDQGGFKLIGYNNLN